MAELAGEKAQAAHSQSVLESAIIQHGRDMFTEYSLGKSSDSLKLQPTAPKLGGSGVISPDGFSEH